MHNLEIQTIKLQTQEFHTNSSRRHTNNDCPFVWYDINIYFIHWAIIHLSLIQAKVSKETHMSKKNLNGINHTFASGMVYIITIILLCSTCITSKQGNLISLIAVTFNIREMIIWTLISILSFTSGLIGFNLYQKSKRTPLLICFIINFYYFVISILTL